MMFGESVYTPIEAAKRARLRFKHTDELFTISDIYGSSWDLTRGKSGVFGRACYDYFTTLADFEYKGINKDGKACYRIKEI